VEGRGLNAQRRTGGAVLGAEASAVRASESGRARTPESKRDYSKSLAKLYSSKLFNTYNKILTTMLLSLRTNQTNRIISPNSSDQLTTGASPRRRSWHTLGLVITHQLPARSTPSATGLGAPTVDVPHHNNLTSRRRCHMTCDLRLTDNKQHFSRIWLVCLIHFI
jgi:hypothetical protein